MRAINNTLDYLPYGSARYEGPIHDYVEFSEKHQLLNRETWRGFVKVFTEDSDDCNDGWRCEFWGKMMRGACLTYMYHPTPELYDVLKEAVLGLLDTVRPDGRISTYSEANQFHGWDMWGRKYVLSGLMHFLAITDDEELKERITVALCKSADYIAEHIGNKEGQISIFDTSTFWLGVNSCSILEPFIALYSITGKKTYLDFAEYIISTGGCSEADLVQLALEDKLMPYEYPEQKAYETMSYFEGILAYYELTGKEMYLEAVKKFVERVNETDITVIGCSGCTHELFDHSVVKQVEYSSKIMQETCVTVTWIRLLSRLMLLTGDIKYADRIEKSGYNALYGAANTESENCYDLINGRELIALPFDSYSPLYNGKRGLGTGGLQYMKDGTYYGCCACIASAGTALLPLTAVLCHKDGLVITGYAEGEINYEFGASKIKLVATTAYPVCCNYTLKLFTSTPCQMKITLRLPEWAEGAKLTVSGEELDFTSNTTLDRVWCDGDRIDIIFNESLKTTELLGKTSYSYGPIVLARDEMKEGVATDTEFTPTSEYTTEEPIRGETHRIKLKTEEGEVLLTDYASCGKRWRNKAANVSVWLNAKANN